MMITAAQVYYITQIYPEPITDEEASEDYAKQIVEESDRCYWEAAAKFLNNIASQPGVQADGLPPCQICGRQPLEHSVFDSNCKGYLPPTA